MAQHIITLTDEEEALFGKMVTITGLTEDELLSKFAKSALVNQAKQYVDDKCREKLDNMTLSQRVAFLEK